MSKIAKVRVSQLAKELGVQSKDIIARCTTEGLDEVKQPQSTVSVGLAETIREWFAGAASAAVAVVEAPAKAAEAIATEEAPKKAKRGVAKPTVEAPAPAPKPSSLRASSEWWSAPPIRIRGTGGAVLRFCARPGSRSLPACSSGNARISISFSIIGSRRADR